MLLAFYFKKWEMESHIISEIYKEKGNLSIHSFIRKCIQNKCNEQAGDYFWGIYSSSNFQKLIYENHIY